MRPASGILGAMRRALGIVALLSGCAAEPPPAARAPLADEGLDRPPAVDVGDGIDAIARADLRGAVLWVDRDRALHLREGSADRVIADEVGGRPVADAQGSIAAWSEPTATGARVRVLRAGAIETIGESSGATSPIAVIGERVILVGSENGGVAGIWIADRDGLGCATNCALAAGQPWGDAFVPPPGDGASITIDGDTISYLDATGVARTARIP